MDKVTSIIEEGSLWLNAFGRVYMIYDLMLSRQISAWSILPLRTSGLIVSV